MADGQVVFEIKGDASNVNQTVKGVTSNIQNESKKWDDAAQQSTSKIENAFSSMAGKIAASLGAAAIASKLLSFGSAAIQVASDLAEVQNVVDTVFGDGAAQIDAWAKKAGTQFGLTELQAKKFTSTLGAMAKSSGMAGDDIMKMSTDLAGLAADMASFYNLDFETAFEKIRSGISGETMPLKQLGINMSAANLEAFALAQGLEKTYAQMDQGEQTMLRYQYLMQATADAQGDFSKTADGFANAQRRIQTSIETIKSRFGEVLLPKIEEVTGAVASFLEKITTPITRTVIDDFNDINADTEQKMKDLEATYQKAQAVIDLIDEIGKKTVTLKDGTVINYESLFANLGNIEKEGGDVRGYLESLGLDVDEIIQKYNVWKESTRQLTSLVPALSSVIDSETYSIDGGTEALQRNLDEWRRVQEKKIAWAAYYAKEQALAERKGQMYVYEFEAGAARKSAERARAELKKQFGEIEFDAEGRIITEPSIMSWHGELDSKQLAIRKQWVDASYEYNKLLDKEQQTKAELKRQTVDYSEAEQELADGKQALIETWGEEEEAIDDTSDALDEYRGKSSQAWKESEKDIKAAADAVKAMNDYYEGVRDSVKQAVDSTLKGFERISTARDDLFKQSSDLASEETEVLTKYSSVWAKWGSDDDSLRAMKARADAGEKLTDVEREAYEALVKVRNAQKEVNKSLDEYKPQTLQANLQSQIDFMEEYIKNLNQLKEWGVSDEMIAMLSDGSKESAAYLQGIVAGGQDEAMKVSELYTEVAEKKKGFVDALTDNKLLVDQTYDALVDKAMEAVAELNLGEEAAESMGETVKGIAEGIRDNVPEVADAVDSLIAELDRLGSFGFSFGFDAGGGLEFLLDGSNEKGLDYVPFDGYLSELHEGEGILTAEENRIWQRFKNGQGSKGNVDYDALGGVMRDNVKAGGDVYLDGRTVGHVISDAQGRSYRALQRSGWQG